MSNNKLRYGSKELVPKHKFDATIPPTVDNDVTEDYGVGSLWIISSGQETYICFDNTEGAAVWGPVGAGGDIEASYWGAI